VFQPGFERGIVHGLQPLRVLEEFPTQINSENILGNRESFLGNREFHRKRSISHTLVSSRFERDLFSPTNFQVENEMSSVRERYGATSEGPIGAALSETVHDRRIPGIHGSGKMLQEDQRRTLARS
jgi:hypothetical protein